MADNLVFIVDDENTICKLLEHWVGTRWGYGTHVFADAESFLSALDENPPHLVLLDIMLPGLSGIDALKEVKQRHPDLPVIMLSAQESIDVAVNTLKLGATDYFTKPIDFPRLEVATRNALKLYEVSRELDQLRDSARTRVHFDNIVSQSGEMEEVFRLVNKVKDNDICVLLLGESGTGKELIARAIHYNGRRKDGPFVVVNCASIPHDLLESELFGHERGAFTGAVQRRIGKFEQAKNGTVFLDEIGELDFGLQAKLLRVIQTKQVERIGGNETITTDARLVSATNRDLRLEVENKRFREDLYFRLSTFPIVLPPLRQRPTDVLLLADHFLRVFSKEHGKPDIRISRGALKLLTEYPWPGNVRELENAIQRAIVMAESATITENDLPLAIQAFKVGGAGSPTASLLSEKQAIIPIEKRKEQAVRHALKVTRGNIAEAAKQLGLGRATLYRLMRKYKISDENN